MLKLRDCMFGFWKMVNSHQLQVRQKLIYMISENPRKRMYINNIIIHTFDTDKHTYIGPSWGA